MNWYDNLYFHNAFKSTVTQKDAKGTTPWVRQGPIKGVLPGQMPSNHCGAAPKNYVCNSPKFSQLKSFLL